MSGLPRIGDVWGGREEKEGNCVRREKERQDRDLKRVDAGGIFRYQGGTKAEEAVSRG
jgi:hypothetical protein